MPTGPPHDSSGTAQPDIRITVEPDYVRVTYRGKIMFGDASGTLREAARISAEADRKRLLFDLRDADYQGYYAQTIAHADEAPALGLDRTFQIAFLGERGHERMLNFMEDVAVNRGYKVKAFLDEAQAVAWISAAAN